MSDNTSGWDEKPQWKVVEANPNNPNNSLINDVLKPIKDELVNILRVSIKEIGKKVNK